MKAQKLADGYKAVLACTFAEHKQVTDRLKREFTELEVRSKALTDECLKNRDIQKRYYEGKIKILDDTLAEVRASSEIEVKALLKECRKN